MTARRIVGLETEFGIQEKNGSGDVVEESNAVVTGYGAEGTATSRRGAIMWDYLGEDPLRDARGFHMDRSAADPSQLTDDPLHPAPSGVGEHHRAAYRGTARGAAHAQRGASQRRAPLHGSCSSRVLVPGNRESAGGRTLGPGGGGDRPGGHGNWQPARA